MRKTKEEGEVFGTTPVGSSGGEGFLYPPERKLGLVVLCLSVSVLNQVACWNGRKKQARWNDDLVYIGCGVNLIGL